MNRIKFVIARYENDRYQDFLKTSIEDVPNDFMKVHVPNDSVEPHGLNEKYNLGTQLLMDNGGIADNDEVVRPNKNALRAIEIPKITTIVNHNLRNVSARIFIKKSIRKTAMKRAMTIEIIDS
jgi:hypothetical protein